MITFKLALRNLMGAGLRTWLNVLVLSLSYVVIIFLHGLLDGWNQQAKTDMISWETGQGQLWQKNYDPFDPIRLQESYSPVPQELSSLVREGKLSPVLVTLATFYPEGRIQSILLKGIGTEQQVLELPTSALAGLSEEIPAIIGKRMAETNKVQAGDLITIRWRDSEGADLAAELRIMKIFSCNVPTVDAGQVWIPLDRLQSMMKVPGEATLLVSGQEELPDLTGGEWVYKDKKFLLADIDQVIKTKSVGTSVMYVVLLLLAMLAIFDTQVLSIFRRQKEIGTQIALGMTRWQVVGLFTVEGAMHAVLAALLAAVYGIPLLMFGAKVGIPMPQGTDTMGLAISDKIFPVYGAGLVLLTVIIVLITSTVVSFIPSRKIARMNPTEAIKGKIQ